MPLSPQARRILEKIADGKSYDQILAADPGLSYLDIFAAVGQGTAHQVTFPATVDDGQLDLDLIGPDRC